MTGAVVLKVDKPIRLTHLTVCLHGFVRVFKNPNAVNEPLPDLGLTASNSPRKSQYFGNGHASLFQDDQTLCGEGRLDIGVYNFNFELEFPTKGVPTSIDVCLAPSLSCALLRICQSANEVLQFERGTISYMIKATVTRPTSIAATSSCDTKISLVETVDVGPLAPPKPRLISLEPISRKTKKRRPTKGKESKGIDSPDATTTEVGSGGEAARLGSPLPDDSASQYGGTIDNHNTPRSPVPSEIQSTVSAATSADSTVSSTTGVSFRLGPVPSSAKSARDSQKSGSKVSLIDQTITANIELLKSGCLPGDNLPLKISIKHTKAIKSMHGIIITLYRQGRIDSAPPLSLFTDMNGKEAERLKHEEYYPKSKTGLGGLSLSSAGSSSIFRKDLAQTFAPILVDPMSLTATINASVRVPEDAFPTISGVPGQMISFKYHVEVVVDLGGKLAGQQRHVPRVGALSVHGGSSGPRGDGGNMLTTWGGSIVGTENIRREKGVVACLFEIIVGTKDSARIRGRGASSVRSQINEWSEEAAVTPATAHEPIYEESLAPSNHDYDKAPPGQPYPYYEHEPSYETQYGEYYHDDYEYQTNYHDAQAPPPHSHMHIPPPEISDEAGLDEKERARRAEQRLLPSQPYADFAGPSTSRGVADPSAPPRPHEESQDEDLYGADDVTPQAANSFHPLHQVNSEQTVGPSAPALEDLVPGAEHTEDKQEMEQRRLMVEASAPPQFGNPSDDADNNNAGEGGSGMPSAPTLDGEEEFRNRYAHLDLPSSSTRHETLPRYER